MLRPYRRDHLDRAAVHGYKGGAQGFVAVDEFVEAAFQRGHVELPRQTDGRGDDIAGEAGLQLVEEPEPLLRERERQLPLACDWLDGRQAAARGSSLRAAQKRQYLRFMLYQLRAQRWSQRAP